MNNAELKRLCEQVGYRLTNKPVQVRFQEPAWKGAKGAVARRGTKAVVDILPGQTGEEFLSVLLHELGHVKVLWTSWTVKVPDYEPGSLNLPASFRTSGTVKVSEDAAEHLKGVWLKYAEENAGKYEGSWLERRLNALAHYLEPELQAIVNKAVKQAVEKALAGVQARQGR